MKAERSETTQVCPAHYLIPKDQRQIDQPGYHLWTGALRGNEANNAALTLRQLNQSYGSHLYPSLIHPDSGTATWINKLVVIYTPV